MTNEGRVETRGPQNQPDQLFGDAEQFASGVFDSSILGLAILDNRLRYLAVNHTFAAIDGIPAREHQGKALSQVLGPDALAIESAVNRILATGEHISKFEVTATLPTRDAPGQFMMTLFPVKDASAVIAKIVVLVVEVTKLREFEKCFADLIGHLPRVRDQVICLGLPDRDENDKVQSWRGAIEMLDTCVRQIHRFSEILRPSALLSTVFLGPQQVSLPDFRPTTSPENRQPSSSQLPHQDNGAIQLSPRLVEIVRLLVQGKSNKEIANALGTSVRTVDHQRETIMLKLDIHSLTELIYYAARHGLTTLPKQSNP